MRGSYALSDQAIDDALTRASPGNYALGYMEDNTFKVFFVGRSDADVRKRLHEWVGMPSRYEKYASPAKASWGVHRRGWFPVDAPALGRVGNADSSYTRFAYSYAPSAEAAFEKECRNYDDFGGNCELDNERRPTQALGARESAWRSKPRVGLSGLAHALNWRPEAELLRIDSA
jgi:hypothetical protein